MVVIHGILSILIFFLSLYVFVDKNNGWATSHTTIYRTHNGGYTWVLDTVFQIINEPFWAIDFLDSLNGVGVGGDIQSSFVAQTHDGGNFWQLNVQWGGYPIYGVDYEAEDKVWAVGGYIGEGTISHSSGSIEDPWPFQYITRYGPLLTVQFSDTLNGWAAGGEIVRTTDGGENWVSVRTFDDSCYFGSFYAIDSLNAWCSYRDSLLHTTDGGVTWVNESIFTKVDIGPKLLDDFEMEAHPNPFNQSTKIYYNVPDFTDGRPVRLELYNTLGRRIRALLNKPVPSGEYWILWNGTDEHGVPVASGVYILNLTVRDVSISRKITLTR